MYYHFLQIPGCDMISRMFNALFHCPNPHGSPNFQHFDSRDLMSVHFRTDWNIPHRSSYNLPAYRLVRYKFKDILAQLEVLIFSSLKSKIQYLRGFFIVNFTTATLPELIETYRMQLSLNTCISCFNPFVLSWASRGVKITIELRDLRQLFFFKKRHSMDCQAINPGWRKIRNRTCCIQTRS